MKSIHFGAGKIGRGFIGAVLSKAGYQVCFADVNQEIIDQINKAGRYTVHVVDYETEDIDVENVCAVNSNDAALLDIFLQAQLVTTAVSVKILPFIAPNVAEGIRERMKKGVEAPLNVVCCENGIRATSQFKQMVYAKLSDKEQAWADEHIAFADSSVDRIVPLVNCANPLDVAVERFFEWNIDRTQLKGIEDSGLQKVEGLNLTDDLDSHIERKLFTVNTGHCSTAFLGNLKGYVYIDEALADEELRATVRKVMQQSGDALVAKFGLDPKEQEKYIDLVLRRFANPYLKDLTFRVGHDPRRKLGPTLYFSYPISMALQQGLPYDYLALAAAAGLAEKVQDDPQCVEIDELIASEGLEAAISSITGQTDKGVIDAIAQEYKKIKKI